MGIIGLFILSALAPLSLGQNVRISSEEPMIENFDRYLLPEYYDSYNTEEIPDYVAQPNIDESSHYEIITSEESNSKESTQSLDGPMDSDWPMHGHDQRHTGRSPYSTASNPGEEKWWYKTEWGFVEGSPVIDNNGVIYFGSWDNHLYAINPDGSLKWKYETKGNVESSPAIDENGVIYVGTHFAPGDGTYLFAINPDGTLKWKYPTSNIYSSPVIADDGTIIFGDTDNWNINALYPNGTLKWGYHTGSNVYSSPAIGDDDTIYVGSIDKYVYALYPNNGTVKWKYNTGSWVHGSPTIADDGIVYIGSDNGYLFALYPNNGTVKWQCNVGGAVWCTPALDNDGNIYVGTWDKEFFAIYPDGTIKWDVQVSHNIWGMSPVVSDDGIIYFGTCDFGPRESGPFYALNPDGSTRWRMEHARMFWASPAIGEDGIIYICTQNRIFDGNDGYIQTGCLRALSELDPNAPSASNINGPSNGKIETSYEYTFKSTSPLGKDVYYYVEWGEQMNSGWVGPYSSGEIVTLSHYWRDSGDYTIRAKAKDTDNLWGPWSEFSVNMKVRNRAYSNTLLLRLLEQFPLLREVLLRLITK